MENNVAGILRELRIYCTSNGNNQGMFPAHLPTYRVEDQGGALVYSNVDEPPAALGGNHTLGFQEALLWWLPMWRPAILDRLGEWITRTGATDEQITAELYAPRTLTIVDTGVDGVFKPYTVPVTDLVATRFKNVGNAAWVARVLADAEELNVTITCRQPCDVHEDAALGLIRNEGKRRWKRAQNDREKQFAA